MDFIKFNNITFLQTIFLSRKRDDKKEKVQLKRKGKKHPTKLINQSNLGYSSKPANHANIKKDKIKKYIIQSQVLNHLNIKEINKKNEKKILTKREKIKIL